MPCLAGLHPALKSSSCHINRSLCSESAGLPVVPRVSESWMGGRAFSYQSPFLWNKLLVWVQGADTLSVFKGELKTLLLDRQQQKKTCTVDSFLVASEHRVAVRGRIRDLISMWAERQAATGVLCSERDYNGIEITVRDFNCCCLSLNRWDGGMWRGEIMKCQVNFQPCHQREPEVWFGEIRWWTCTLSAPSPSFLWF